MDNNNNNIDNYLEIVSKSLNENNEITLKNIETIKGLSPYKVADINDEEIINRYAVFKIIKRIVNNDDEERKEFNDEERKELLHKIIQGNFVDALLYSRDNNLLNSDGQINNVKNTLLDLFYDTYEYYKNLRENNNKQDTNNEQDSYYSIYLTAINAINKMKNDDDNDKSKFAFSILDIFKFEDLKRDITKETTKNSSQVSGNKIQQGYGENNCPEMVRNEYLEMFLSNDDKKNDDSTQKDDDNQNIFDNNNLPITEDKNSKESSINDKKGSNKSRQKIKFISKSKNKKRLIRKLIAASIATIMAVATFSITSKLLNNNIGESNDIISNSVISSEANDTILKNDSSNITSDNNGADIVKKDTTTTNTNSTISTDNIKKNTNNNNNISSTTNTNNTNKEESSKDKSDNAIINEIPVNIGDEVTLKDAIIYADVYKAADNEIVVNASLGKDLKRTVSSILLKKDGENYYSNNKDEVIKKCREGWTPISASISNDGGIEGAEPIDNLVKVSEKIDNKEIDNSTEKTEDNKINNSDTVNNIQNNINEIMKEKESSNNKNNEKASNNNVTTQNNYEKNTIDSDDNTLNNIKNNISNIKEEKSFDDNNISENVGNKVKNILAEKIKINDKVTLDKGIIYEDIYSASDKENALPAYNENKKVRSISSVLLTKYGLNRYSSDQEEINKYISQGWVVKAVLISNEKGYEGFEPIDNLIKVEDNTVGGKHL